MFGLGPVEIVVLGAIAVMLYGKQLPEVGRSLGKAVGDLRRQWTALARELDVSAVVDGRLPASGGSPRFPSVAHRAEDVPLVAGPRFDPPAGEG